MSQGGHKRACLVSLRKLGTHETWTTQGTWTERFVREQVPGRKTQALCEQKRSERDLGRARGKG